MTTRQEKAYKAQNQIVAQSNTFIRSRYLLTLQQQKCLLYVISKIKPNDDISDGITLSFRELCDTLAIDISDGGTYYKRLKADLQALTQRHLVKFPDGSLKTLSFLGDVDALPLTDTITITFNPHMRDFLYELRSNYTMYVLQNALVCNSVHSIRLYEVLKSYTTRKRLEEQDAIHKTIKIDDLRSVMCVTGYNRWVDFHRYVLKKAVEEINDVMEDIHVEYLPMKSQGRAIDSVQFVITYAKARQRLKASAAKKQRLKQPKRP